MKLSRILIASMLLFAMPGFGQDRAVPDHRAAHPPPVADQATHYGWADVLNVDRVYDNAENEEPAATDEQPQQDCNEAPAPPPPDSEEHADSRVGGTVVGAIIGGIVGHAFGRGDGRKVTTAAGVVAGGVVGNQVAAANDQRQAVDAQRQADAEREAVAASLRNCRNAAPPPPERRIVGYDVEYRYKGEIYMARLAYDPGDRLRVKVSVTPAD